MKNSLSPIAIGFFAVSLLCALTIIAGMVLFYAAGDGPEASLYVQYSLMFNPFGYWLIVLSLLAFGALAQASSDYHAYLYESKAPFVSPTLLYALGVFMLLAAAGDFIFQAVAEMMARAQIAASAIRQSEFGGSFGPDRFLKTRTLPYNLLQYLVPIGHALTGALLISVAQRLGRLRLEAATSVAEGTTNA